MASSHNHFDPLGVTFVISRKKKKNLLSPQKAGPYWVLMVLEVPQFPIPSGVFTNSF